MIVIAIIVAVMLLIGLLAVLVVMGAGQICRRPVSFKDTPGENSNSEEHKQ